MWGSRWCGVVFSCILFFSKRTTFCSQTFNTNTLHSISTCSHIFGCPVLFLLSFKTLALPMLLALWLGLQFLLESRSVSCWAGGAGLRRRGETCHHLPCEVPAVASSLLSSSAWASSHSCARAATSSSPYFSANVSSSSGRLYASVFVPVSPLNASFESLSFNCAVGRADQTARHLPHNVRC